MSRHTTHQVGKCLTTFMRSSNIEIYQFVGPLFTVCPTQLHRIASVPEINKVHPFHGFPSFTSRQGIILFANISSRKDNDFCLSPIISFIIILPFSELFLSNNCKTTDKNTISFLFHHICKEEIIRYYQTTFQVYYLHLYPIYKASTGDMTNGTLSVGHTPSIMG